MPVARALRHESGQTLIEVVAAAALLLVIAISTTTVLISSDKAAGSSSARAGAASLLASEQQRLRSLSAVGSLTDYSSTRTTTLPVGGTSNPSRTYTVASTVAPARDSTGDVSCTVDSSAPDYLHARTAVTWRGGGPVVGESLLSPSPGSEARTLGTLAVQVVDRNTNPVSGATVTVGNRTRTTNALGCVVLAYMPAGTYGVSASSGSAVAPDGSSPATDSVTVTAGQTAQETLTLDAPGTLPIAFDSATSAGVTIPATIAAPTSLSVTSTDPRFNGTTAASLPKPRVLPWSSSSPAVAGLFPFVAARSYAVYAGNCAGNDPATWSVPAASQSTATVVSGANAALKVRMPTVALQLVGPANPNGLQATLTPDTTVTGMAGCTGTVTMPASATVGSTRGVTSLALPYGSYTACAATTGYKVTGVKVANTSPSGTALIKVTMAAASGAQTC